MPLHCCNCGKKDTKNRSVNTTSKLCPECESKINTTTIVTTIEDNSIVANPSVDDMNESEHTSHTSQSSTKMPACTRCKKNKKGQLTAGNVCNDCINE